MPGQVDAALVKSLYMHLYSGLKDWVDGFFESEGLNTLNELLIGALCSKS